jgi:hypothetical protein
MASKPSLSKNTIKRGDPLPDVPSPAKSFSFKRKNKALTKQVGQVEKLSQSFMSIEQSPVQMPVPGRGKNSTVETANRLCDLN